MLYVIRHKDTKKFFSGKNDLWRYFLNGQGPSIRNKCAHQDVHKAAFYVSKQNALNTIKDTTRRCKKYPLGYHSLPENKCEIVGVQVTLVEED